MLPARLHQPGEERIYTFAFAEKLRPGDALIGTATVTADAGITVISTRSDLDRGLVSATLSGGVNGSDYRVECMHDTNDGEILIVAMILEVRRLDQ